MKDMQPTMPGYTAAETAKLQQLVAVFASFFTLVLGLAVTVNALLNMRLLRGYYLAQKSDADGGNNAS